MMCDSGCAWLRFPNPWGGVGQCYVVLCPIIAGKHPAMAVLLVGSYCLKWSFHIARK